MDLKKHIISNTILKLFVHIVLVIGFIFSLITINQGIVVGENILSENNYSLVIGIIIFAIILLIVLSSYTVFINLKKYKLSKKNLAINNKIQKNYELIEIIIMSINLLLIIYLLIIFPLQYDSSNNYTFSISIAMIILAFTYMIVVVYNNYFRKEQEEITIDVIAEGSILAALAIVLSIASDLIPGLKMPNGGSFSLSMLPLFIFALRRGVTPGIIMGLLYSVVNFLLDGLFFHWGSIFFDYLLPFSLLAGVAGLFSKKAQKGHYSATILAVLFGGSVRYIFHGLSGAIFFAEYAGEYNAWFYSFIIYNLPYMAISTIGSLIITLILQNRFITLDSRIR